MIALRILNLIVWGAMFLFMLRGAIASVTRHARYGDPMRLACALTAIIFLGFNLFWLFAPASHIAAPLAEDTTLNLLLVLSAAVGGFIMKLGRTYGRGVLLDRKEDAGDD